jgi:signal transduction histidine kinase
MKNIQSSDFKKPLADDATPSLTETVLMSISEYVCVLNPDRTFAFMNQAMREFVGAAAPIETKTVADLNLEVDLADKLQEEIDETFANGKNFEGNMFIWTPVAAQDGSIAMVIGVGSSRQTDKQSADRHTGKARQNFLLHLSDRLRPLSDTLAIEKEITNSLGAYLQVDRAYYAACDESRELAVIEHDYVRNGATSLAGIHHYKDFEAIVKMIRTGNAFIAEDVLDMPEVQTQLDSYLGNQMRALVAIPLMKDGLMVACLAVTSSVCRQWTQSEISLIGEVAERTWEAVERGRSESALQDIEQQFRAFVATSSELVYRMSADWRQMYNLSGNGLLRDTTQPISNWLESYIPEDEQAHVRAVINHAITSKSMFELEHRVNQADGGVGWVISRAIPLLDQQGNVVEWLGAANDITLRKTAEQQLKGFASRLEHEVNVRTEQLKENRDKLQLIFDTTLMQMSILEAVRDKSNQIVDFKIQFANRELERETGRGDLVGKYYAEEYPGIRESHLFDLIVKTIESGISQQVEYYYPHEGFNKWYSCMFVKLNDGVVATNMDVSARKNAEEERFKNYLLLQHSEDMASLGSWDFNLLTGVFTWSDGMYRLFNLEKGTEVSPQIYLDYTTENGRSAAQRVVDHIRKGDTDFTETLEIVISGQVKILYVKATVVKNSEGQPVRVLGVDMDITASRLAEEKIKKMEAEQQQKIFQVTLSSQEEERRRISESLHNGLAQTLYGVKINLSGLSAEYAATDPIAYAQSKMYTNDLLKNAIDETRRISHQLMPSILEDFGLKASIMDACKQLSDNVKFNCSFSGLEPRSDKYLELAIYRTVQELIMNTAKHSGAKTANVKVKIDEKQVSIVVSDDGIGMQEDTNAKNGIGLASIRSKVKLLNGQIIINSAPGLGTSVTVYLPIP